MDLSEAGGPAFPFKSYGETGMTLRDYFAAQAMVPIVSGRPWPISGIVPGDEKLAETMATYAYMAADAMLRAREH